MNVQVDLPKESAFVTDSALILTEKLLATMVIFQALVFYTELYHF